MKSDSGKPSRTVHGERGGERRPLYRAIREAIRRDIELRYYGPGERLPSDGDLARRFDASRLTVMRALRDLEEEGLVQRRAGSGTFVRAMADGGSRDFGLLMPDIGEGEVFEPIAEGIARASESLHQRLLWGEIAAPARGKEEQAEELCRYFIARKVAGVFFAAVELTAHQDEVNQRICADLDRAGIPVVLVDRCISRFPYRSRYDLVGIDNRLAGYRMTRHLLKSGCRKVAFAYQAGSAPTAEARFAGYREALWQSGADGGDPIVFLTGGAEEESALRKFMETVQPGGLVCANDLTAAQLFHRLLQLGVRIPEDVRMVGINDVKYARFLPVPLTTLHQPCQQIGAAAMWAMLDRLERPDTPARDILLDCQLVVRQSCGSSPASTS